MKFWNLWTEWWPKWKMTLWTQKRGHCACPSSSHITDLFIDTVSKALEYWFLRMKNCTQVCIRNVCSLCIPEYKIWECLIAWLRVLRLIGVDCIVDMARTKQTAQKQPTGGKPPATYPHRKPSSKKRWVGSSQDKSAPVAVRLARENARLWSKAVNATAQGYYKGPVGPTSSGHRRCYGRQALNKIWFYQENVNLLIRQLPFSHFVRELLYDKKPQMTDPWWMQAMAMYILQWAAEAYLTGLLKDANLITSHTKHVTLMPKDIQLALCKSEEREVKRCENCA